MSSLRLDKFLSSQLNISRTDAKKLLRQGCVSVNSSYVKKADFLINADSDVICVNGRELTYKEHIYIMQYKPKGVVSSTDSPGDVTVIDILPDNLKRSGLFPAGRLDKYTTGFVLITDDGKFAHNILSPSHHVIKTYEADIRDRLTDDDIKRFTEGMMLGSELFKPASVSYTCTDKETGLNRYCVRISEGRYHQIRRMFDDTGKPVVELKRTHIGGLKLDDSLMPGESREISSEELKILVGISD